jgi:hypothetical protein
MGPFNMDTAAVPTSVHCDRLTEAQVGGTKDLQCASNINKKVNDTVSVVEAYLQYLPPNILADDSSGYVFTYS